MNNTNAILVNPIGDSFGMQHPGHPAQFSYTNGCSAPMGLIICGQPVDNLINTLFYWIRTLLGHQGGHETCYENAVKDRKDIRTHILLIIIIIKYISNIGNGVFASFFY